MSWSEIVLRFIAGGAVVTLFSMMGDVVRPKSFAGLFGAAPSIALATLGLTIVHHGKSYASTEARSMMLGAAAFLLYAAAVSFVLMRYRTGTLRTTLALLPVWFVSALGFWWLMVRVV